MKKLLVKNISKFLLESISTKLNDQLLSQFPFPKKLQTQTVSAEKMLKTCTFAKKAAHKML